jgi:hypothetical protein
MTGDDCFNGGYNTLEHGSNPGGTIGAIQMELYSAIRFNTAQHKARAVVSWSMSFAQAP